MSETDTAPMYTYMTSSATNSVLTSDCLDQHSAAPTGRLLEDPKQLCSK